MNLDRVTITGADDLTDPERLVAIEERFPFVEWGILLSKSSEGQPRFPKTRWIEKLQRLSVKLSGHLCGSWVRDLCVGNVSFLRDRPTIADVDGFRRMQLNFHAIAHTVKAAELRSALDVFPAPEGFIFQLDGVNDPLLDEIPSAAPLFDLSGGAGVLPDKWPVPLRGRMGYAGGLSPENLEAELVKIQRAVSKAADKPAVWIDVETHVRTNSGFALDLARVERFLDIASAWVR